MSSGTYYYYPAPTRTDGRYITWAETRLAWDHDGDGGATTPAIDANVVPYIYVTTSTTDGANPRTSIGGTVITQASAPTTMPAMPMCLADTPRAGVRAIVPALMRRRPGLW